MRASLGPGQASPLNRRPPPSFASRTGGYGLKEMSQVERSRVQRWRELLNSERDAAALYARLAAAETGERRTIFEELAAIERRHLKPARLRCGAALFDQERHNGAPDGDRVGGARIVRSRRRDRSPQRSLRPALRSAPAHHRWSRRPLSLLASGTSSALPFPDVDTATRGEPWTSPS
jgi:hypothetical protein